MEDFIVCFPGSTAEYWDDLEIDDHNIWDYCGKLEDKKTYDYGDYILIYGKYSEDSNPPMNRYITLPNGDVDIICGPLIIAKKSGDESKPYKRLSVDEEHGKEMAKALAFYNAHEFVCAFNKLFVLSVDVTEKTVIQVIDIKKPEEESAENE